ncbi:MAG: helix-turn-helix domain-containing protein [Bacillota bacterium]|nr:helix-turn-helix domain-containing protein [Bacillota bacterium]
MRLLVVEDEALQRRALAQVLAGLAPHGEVLTARDGVEALQAARAAPPDVVFLDILMPRMDGLQAARELRAVSPEATMFILTAHEDFGYARQALALGVEQYLLKPVGAADLRRCLDLAEEQLRARRARAEREQELRGVLADAMPLIRTQLVRDLCLGTITSPQEYARRAQLVDLAAQPCLAISVGLRPPQGDSCAALRQPASEVELEVLRREVTQGMEQLCASLSPSAIVGRTGHDEIVLLLPESMARAPGRSAHASLRRIVAGTLEVSASAGFEAAVGIGPHTSGALAVWRSYQAAVRARQRAWLLGAVSQRVLSADDLGEAEPGEDAAYPLLAERGLAEAVRLGQREGAGGYLMQLSAYFASPSAGQPPGAARRLRLVEALALMARSAGEGGAPAQDVLDANARFLEEALQDTTAEALAETLARAADAFLAAASRAQSVRQSGLAARAAAYLEGHFPEQISLTDMAEELHISPFYLSHVFRQAIGLSFSEYLTKVRIAEAKRLLTATGLPVGEISARVGYREPNYFGRVFKKATGMTPLAWRRAH